MMDPSRLREARIKAKLTQYKLATIVGVHPSQVSRFESGERRPRFDEARKIAAALGIPLSEFIRTGEHGPPPMGLGEWAGNSTAPQSRPDTVIISLPLPEGRATVECPDGLSHDSKEALKEWLALIAKLIARE